MSSSIDLIGEHPSFVVRIIAGLGSSLLALVSLVNFGALPIGATWLCIVGYWKLVLVWFIAALFSPKIMGLITLPLFGIDLLAAKLINERLSFVRPMFGAMLVVCSYISYAIVFGAWNLISFNYVARSVSEKATIPALLLAFAVAVWPIQAMTDPRDPGIQETLSLLCNMVQMLAMSVMLLFGVGDLRWYITACIIAILFFMPLQTGIALKAGEFPRRRK
jgi:hypothetical protein